jgi:hypothetical protein
MSIHRFSSGRGARKSDHPRHRVPDWGQQAPQLSRPGQGIKNFKKSIKGIGGDDDDEK